MVRVIRNRVRKFFSALVIARESDRVIADAIYVQSESKNWTIFHHLSKFITYVYDDI